MPRMQDGSSAQAGRLHGPAPSHRTNNPPMHHARMLHHSQGTRPLRQTPQAEAASRRNLEAIALRRMGYTEEASQVQDPQGRTPRRNHRGRNLHRSRPHRSRRERLRYLWRHHHRRAIPRQGKRIDRPHRSHLSRWRTRNQQRSRHSPSLQHQTRQQKPTFERLYEPRGRCPLGPRLGGLRVLGCSLPDIFSSFCEVVSNGCSKGSCARVAPG